MNKPNYKNWIPKWMLYAYGAGALLSFVLLVVFALVLHGVAKTILVIIAILAFLACALAGGWSMFAYNRFSYNGKRKLSKSIIEGTAEYVSIPDGGKALDIGCGSGALTVAVAKRNPNSEIIGCDRWTKEYSDYSKLLCKENARAEGLENVKFQKGDATALPFEDETFDAVFSNYVYHNVAGSDKQALLLETLRTLKKGGTFAIHDLMGKKRYGDMEAFCQKLRNMGYEKVEMLDTTDKFMTKGEAKLMLLADSTLLYGRK